MDKIKITFPSGVSVRATLQRDVEPELAESLWQRLDVRRKGLAKITISTGNSYSIFFRPPSEAPEKSGTLRAPIGNRRLLYTELQDGDILWNNSRLYCCYGPCTEPGLVGSKVAQVDEECMETYHEESEEIRNHYFFYHQVPIVYVEREEA